MKIKIFKRKLDANGFSLVEVIASIVLISIILLSFSYLIINSLKTTKTSENIVDYTYLAQTEIEKIYAVSTNHITNNFEDKKNSIITTLGYTDEGEVDGYTVLKKNNGQNIYIYVKMKSHDVYNDLTNLIVEVFDQDTDTSRTPKAHMETILSWGS